MTPETKLESTMAARMAGFTVLGKSPAGVYLRLNRPVWERLPSDVRNSRLLNGYGEWLHKLVCWHASRQVFVGTFFLRNRPALELLRRLVERRHGGPEFNLAVLGCSIGAEVYSINWTLRSAFPELKLRMIASDISRRVLDYARRGVYDRNTGEFLGTPPGESIFERLTVAEKEGLFDWSEGRGSIKPWLREGIVWELADALDSELPRRFGLQDIVVANNFLCHLPRREAERCLRNLARLVRPGGHLFVAGVDLDIRTRVARASGWQPLAELREEIHEGDPSIRNGWPWAWWGLEPLNRRRKDWEWRYASVFQLNEERNGKSSALQPEEPLT